MVHGPYKLRRRKPKFTDLTINDINHLINLHSYTDGNKDVIYCLGKSYFVLKGLNLITKENKMTMEGIEFLQELYYKQKRKKKC